MELPEAKRDCFGQMVILCN